MAQHYETLEIMDKETGKGIGKYRKVVHNTSGTWARGLCDHEHDTREEADACPDIQEEMEQMFPTLVPCPSCNHRMRKSELDKKLHTDTGRIAFEAYDKDRGGINHLGKPTPKWEELPQEIQHAWQVAATAVSDLVAIALVSEFSSPVDEQGDVNTHDESGANPGDEE